MRKIVDIDQDATWWRSPTSYTSYEGVRVTLDDGKEILIGISNEQSCCESWGYLIMEDDPKDFIGGEVLEVKVVNGDYKVLEKVLEFGLYEGDAMFVNVETTKGTLQVVCYNEHNGYYSHEAVVVSEQLTEEVYL